MGSHASGKMNQLLAIAEEIVQLLAPAITSITPNTGPFSGGNTVTITSSNFIKGLIVFFGGKLAGNVQVLSATSITVTVPAASPATKATTLAQLQKQ